MKKILTVALIGILFGCSPSMKVSKVTSGENRNAKQGFYYALPKANILVNIDIKQTKVKPGKYSKYAIYVTDEKVEKTIKTKFVIENITINTVSDIDTSNIYRVEIDNNFMKKNSFSMEFLQKGEIKGAEFITEDQTVKLVTTTLNTVGTLFGKVVGAMLGTGGTRKLDSAQTLTIIDSVNQIVDKIKWIRIQKETLLSNSTWEGDAISLKYMIEELTKKETELLSCFLGTKKTKVITYQFLIEPDKSITTYELLAINKENGIKRLYSKGNTVWNTEFDNDTLTKSDTVILQLEEKASIATVIKNETVKINSNSNGLIYRIPANYYAKILRNKRNKKVEEMQIPQFGEIAAIPVGLKEVKVTFFQKTGAINTISGTNTVLQLEDVEAIGETINNLDSLYVKKDERDRIIEDLEKQVKIKELEDKLNGVISDEE